LSAPAFAGEADQAFFNGNGLYEKGDYAGAAAEYEKVRSMGLESGNLYYNLGNAYVKEGKLAEAILSYRRALRLMPRDGDLEANLGYADLSVKDRFPPPGRNFFTRLLDRFASLMTVNEFAILSSAVLILFWVTAMASLLLRGAR
jgi:tetratricopeptide (TPR) repeat protein